MKSRVLAVTICLLVGSSLLFGQAKSPSGQKPGSGPSHSRVKPPSYNSCDNSTPMTIADGSSDIKDFVDVYGDAWYLAYVKGGHSYTAEAWNPYYQDTSWQNGRPSLSLWASGCTPAPFTDVQNIDPVLNWGFNDRISWIQPSDAWVFVHLSNNDNVTAYDYNFRIVDTTQFSPRWSTYSGFLTQWGLNNLTESDISGVFTVFNTAGNAIKTVNVTVPAGKVKFYSTVPGDLNLPANTSGSVMFAYIGPAGAIQPDAAILNSTVTVVFPVKFEARNYQH